MDLNDVKPGLSVKVTALGSTGGMIIAAKHLICRRVGVKGTVKNWVPGHGGDVWYIQHENSPDVGAYVFNEFELA